MHDTRTALPAVCVWRQCNRVGSEECVTPSGAVPWPCAGIMLPSCGNQPNCFCVCLCTQVQCFVAGRTVTPRGFSMPGRVEAVLCFWWLMPLLAATSSCFWLGPTAKAEASVTKNGLPWLGRIRTAEDRKSYFNSITVKPWWDFQAHEHFSEVRTSRAVK